MPDTAIPIPWTPEQRAQAQAAAESFNAFAVALVTAMKPVAEAARQTMISAIRYAEQYTAAMKPPADRPAYQSTHGPAHTRRTHK